MPSKNDVNPISGTLTYAFGVREGRININAIQDTDEESDEVFTVKLLTAKGGATISTTDYMAKLTGMKESSFLAFPLHIITTFNDPGKEDI